MRRFKRRRRKSWIRFARPDLLRRQKFDSSTGKLRQTDRHVTMTDMLLSTEIWFFNRQAQTDRQTDRHVTMTETSQSHKFDNSTDKLRETDMLQWQTCSIDRKLILQQASSETYSFVRKRTKRDRNNSMETSTFEHLNYLKKHLNLKPSLSQFFWGNTDREGGT